MRPSGTPPRSSLRANTRRSARRHTVRATWATAAARQPPGRMKAVRGSTRASMRSIQDSSPSVLHDRGSWVTRPPGSARTLPTTKSEFWIATSSAETPSGRSSLVKKSDVRDQFVHSAVSLYTNIIFADPAPREQRRFPIVPRLGVDLHPRILLESSRGQTAFERVCRSKGPIAGPGRESTPPLC